MFELEQVQWSFKGWGAKFHRKWNFRWRSQDLLGSFWAQSRGTESIQECLGTFLEWFRDEIFFVSFGEIGVKNMMFRCIRWFHVFSFALTLRMNGRLQWNIDPSSFAIPEGCFAPLLCKEHRRPNIGKWLVEPYGAKHPSWGSKLEIRGVVWNRYKKHGFWAFWHV